MQEIPNRTSLHFDDLRLTALCDPVGSATYLICMKYPDVYYKLNVKKRIILQFGRVEPATFHLQSARHTTRLLCHLWTTQFDIPIYKGTEIRLLHLHLCVCVCVCAPRVYACVCVSVCMSEWESERKREIHSISQVCGGVADTCYILFW